MRAREFVIEAQHSIRDQIIHAVDINGGSLDDYFVRFTKRDHLGFSDQQTFGRFPDVDDPDFDIDRITAQARGRRVLWFYPLKTYLSAREGTYAMDFPYVWLVKLKPNAWLQTVRSGDREVKPAPAGKERVGILRMSFTPAALFFKHGFDLIGKFYDYAGQHQRHGQVKRMAEDRENYNGLNILLQQDEDEVFVKASAGGRELGHVLFVQDGEYLMPQDLEVDERYRGQGIAAAMYDYVKSQGYKIRRSGQQTDAGAGFWAKHRAEQNVWEQGVTEDKPQGITAYHGNQGGLHGDLITPMWWSENKDTAVYYATQSGGDGTVFTATLSCKNPYVITDKDETNTVVEKFKTLAQKGYDSIYDPRGHDWIPFYNKDIHVTDEEYVEGEQQGVAEALRNSGYKEIEFVCANPEFPEATDPKLQKQMYAGLQQIPGVIPLFQDQSDWSEGQYSLTAIYKDRAVRGAILKLAKQLGVKVDLEQPVSDDYVDRAIRGEHEGQQHMAEGRDFDRCFGQACKLYDRAVDKNLKPKLVQVADFQGDGSGADPRWGKLPQHVWQHYVVIVGDQVLDPTAQQFGPDMPTQYPVSDLDRLWGKQYQIRPRENMAEGSDNLNYIGNCTDDDVIEHIFGDATGFAQAVEEYGDEFVLDDLVVKYDPETDVHSFYYKKQGVAEGKHASQYLSQIPMLTWKPVSRSVWNTIQDEGLDQEQQAPDHSNWVMASLSITTEHAQALQALEDDALEYFNRFDIDLKSQYPGLTDLIDYDRGTVTIVKPMSVTENFADGRNPQHKGDSARHGIPKHATIAQLEKIRSSKTASPRKKQLAHWQINMRRGKAKR